MAIRIVQLGSPRRAGEGLRLGTVRRPPRGVPKSEFARRNYYDVWLPELAPSAPVVSWALSDPWTPGRRYRDERSLPVEGRPPAAGHRIELPCVFSSPTHFPVAPSGEDASH